MNKIIFALLLAALVMPVSAAKTPKPGQLYDYKVTRVKDGDTVEIEANFLPAPLKPVLSVRVLGVDTPEKAPRAQCPAEAAGGAAATEFTKKAIANAKHIQIELVSWDKFGGRVLGDVILDGKRLSQQLIDNGLARAYHGEAKTSWCK
jgi:endonuclease YncB( thermonuclease family)